MSTEQELQMIEEAAATWFFERERGLSPEREAELRRWLVADPRHEAALKALTETWALLGESPALAEPVESAAAAGARGGFSAVYWVTGLAAAAVVALGVFSWVGGAPTGGAIGGAAEYRLTATTAVGGWRKVELPDGSVIQLNTSSAVDVRFEPGVRRVALERGEAHFAVAKDATRPFVVSAGGVDVRVLGTVFNVRVREQAVDVLVTEGKVRVQAPTNTEVNAEASAGDGARAAAAVPISELVAGQRVSVERNEAVAVKAMRKAPVVASETEVRQTLAWQNRRLDFEATPLGEIVAEVNRYSRHQLVIADPALKDRKFGGSFPANDSATLVRMLEADFGVVAERRGQETVLRAKRP